MSSVRGGGSLALKSPQPSNESSFKSITLDDIKQNAFFIKKKYDSMHRKSESKLTQGSLYNLIQAKAATNRKRELSSKIIEKSTSNLSTVNNYINAYALPISLDTRSKMMAMFADAKNNIASNSEKTTKQTCSPATNSLKSPITKFNRFSKCIQLPAKTLDLPDMLKDKVIIVDHKVDHLQKTKMLRKAENDLTQFKGEYVDLRNRKKRAAVATDQAVLCQDIVETIEDLLHSECDEQEMYNLIEAKFGKSSVFNTILFEKKSQLRRLSARSLHRLIFIRAEKSPGNFAAEIRSLRHAVSMKGSDVKKKAKGSILIIISLQAHTVEAEGHQSIRGEGKDVKH